MYRGLDILLVHFELIGPFHIEPKETCMFNQKRLRSVNAWGVWLFVAVIGLTAQVETATAQVWIAPDHSVVQIGRQYPIPVGGFYNVGPVVVLPGNRFVRIGGAYSGVIISPRYGYLNGPVFVKPFTANQRIQASNFLRAPQVGPMP